MITARLPGSSGPDPYLRTIVYTPVHPNSLFTTVFLLQYQPLAGLHVSLRRIIPSVFTSSSPSLILHVAPSRVAVVRHHGVVQATFYFFIV